MKTFKSILMLAILVSVCLSGCSSDDETVYVIYEESLEAGSHIAEMDLVDGNGNPIPAGYYEIRLTANNYSDNGYFTIDSETWTQDPKETGLQSLYPLGGFMKIPFSIPEAATVKFTVRRAKAIGI